jgi:signal transduction histidine kinase/ActR/RegA family two-component response regulator
VESLTASPLEWSDFIAPEDRERVQAAFAELTRDVPGLDVEYRITRPDGEIRWVRARGFQVRDAAGQVIRHTGIVTDITERKHQEVERARLLLQLEAEQARLVDIFKNAPAFIASLRGPDHVFELANNGYYDLVGQRQLIGRKVRDAFPDLKDQGFFERLDSVYETGVPFVGNEMPIELSSGNGGPPDLRYINFVYHPLRDLEGRVSGIISHGVDVTEQMLSRGRLHETENQLRQSQKLESVGLLAGGIAHDFNNLLTVIGGYSDLTLRHLNGADPLARNVEEIKKAADRAALLTRQLLAFSRKQILQPKVVDLNEVVHDIGKMLHRLLGETMELHIVPGSGLGRVKADPGQIQQVILNLSINARDSCPKGGKLTIETANVYLDEEYALQHDAVRPGWHVMLAVADTGQGMDAETQKHIFEPFFTTKEQGKGTGLGLATVYGIVKQSDGTVWFVSEVGKGTTFRIYLPLVDDAVTADTDTPLLETVAGSETVLLAEDDEMVRNLTRESLKMSGYVVLETSNGREALKASKNFDGPIHLLLTDVVMPGMSGRELAENLLTSRPKTRVLYMSGYTDLPLFHQGVLQGDIAFIQKPFTPDSLTLKVAEVLHPNLSHTRKLESTISGS